QRVTALIELGHAKGRTLEWLETTQVSHQEPPNGLNNARPTMQSKLTAYSRSANRKYWLVPLSSVCGTGYTNGSAERYTVVCPVMYRYAPPAGAAPPFAPVPGYPPPNTMIDPKSVFQRPPSSRIRW